MYFGNGLGYGYGYGLFFDPTYILVIIGALICIIASANIKWTFHRYSKQMNRRGYTAAQVARMILDHEGLYKVDIEHISGDLTDHYDPRADVVRLSSTVYNSSSVAAIGVAAHECGHVLQHHKGYVPIRVRNTLVPVVNIGSTLSMPIIILGVILSSLNMVNFGIILFSLTLVFQVVTLPVEFDASHRALRILKNNGILFEDEVKSSRKVLRAAALTYVAAVVSTLLQILRLVLIFAANTRDDD
ncbi:hypothetical protein SAMN04487761_12529 [Lachnospiraceae bacterium C7]|nr:hypothetical protein SAMN04487761_12529 [Lachnospiraceae bacterium C7]